MIALGYDEGSLRVRTLALVIFSLALSICASIIYYFDISQPLDDLILDYQQRHSRASFAEADTPLIYVAIEDLSYQDWPWPRLDYAMILEAMRPSYPRVIAFDIPFHGQDTFSQDFDAKFARVLDRMRSVILPATALQMKNYGSDPTNIITIPFRGSARQIQQYNSTLWPLDTFSQRSNIGFSNITPAVNNTVRRLPLVFRYHSKLVPSWLLLCYSEFIGADLQKSEVLPGQYIILRDAERNVLGELPLDQKGRMLLRFYKIDPPITNYEFNDVILASQSPDPIAIAGVNMLGLRDKLVLIGRNAEGIFEPLNTPLEKNVPPVEINLQGLHNLLHQHYTSTLPVHFLSILLFIIIFISTSLSFVFGWFRGTILFIPFVITHTSSSFLMYEIQNLWIPSGLLTVTCLTAWMGGIILNFIFARKHLKAQLELFD
ncbi:MAG: CHASE2 domain-containing protein [Verrucomicrobiota bacterium]